MTAASSAAASASAASDPSPRGSVAAVVVASSSSSSSALLLRRFLALLLLAAAAPASVRSFRLASTSSSAFALASSLRRGPPSTRFSIASNLPPPSSWPGSGLVDRRSAPPPPTARRPPSSSSLAMSSSATAASASATVPSWSDLRAASTSTPVGSALTADADLRRSGRGPAHVSNVLRLFDSPSEDGGERPKLTVWRDQAGWCPYCQKTMLLIEEKGVPINVGLVPMRSYGDKPKEFLNMVPSGLLPALTVETDDGGGTQVITESAVIMELLDRWHPEEQGYPSMLPASDDGEGNARYDRLAGLERELFSRWCGLLFRPEGPSVGGGGGGGGGILGMLTGKKDGSGISGAMEAFLECLTRVDDALASTSGPWFFDDKPHPTMIDFVYVSHLERMLASCAHWKGLDLRSSEWSEKFPAINAWFDAFEKRECYLAFKSDYYTHVKDIPPQYGPGYDGGFEKEREEYSRCVLGTDGKSWNLPLPHDDPLQPLYRGLPLPLAALKAAGITADDDGSYVDADPKSMERACRQMAAWKLSSNGEKVSSFAARGGPDGSRNPRKTFGAELADPYAAPDGSIEGRVDAALRVVCSALLAEVDDGKERNAASLSERGESLRTAVPAEAGPGVKESLRYLRDRVGVPRDLPLASARQLRAHLNWAIDAIG